MISIHNKLHEHEAEINIFGDIGEGFFGEGNTKETLLADLEGITAPNITVNISSLGGSVDDAFTMFAILRKKKAHITTVVQGFTASSGTIIAMAGDTIKMDDVALFLVHNASMGLFGNADELREKADELDQIDDRIADISQSAIKRNGKHKRKTQILSLMAQERWITAEEAEEFGFIAEIVPTMSAAASIKKDIENLKGVKELPKIPDNYINQIEMKKEIKLSVADRLSGSVEVEIDLDEVTNKLQEEFTSLTDDFKVTKTDLEDVQNTLKVKNEELESSITMVTDLETKNESLAEEVKNKVKEIESFKKQIEDLKNQALAEELKEGSNGGEAKKEPKAKSAKQEADEYRAKRARGEK